MLSKMGGVFAPRPTPGPHKLRECLPLILLLRNRLKYALNGRECRTILKRRLVEVDGKVRTDHTYPAGFMDVVTIPNSGDHFRLLYDPKGRFVVHPIAKTEAKFKLCKVVKLATAKQGVPFILTHDGRKIRYPDPDVRVSDTIKVDIATGRMTKFVKFAAGNLCYVTGGHSRGRIGEVVHREKHMGDFDIITVKDVTGEKFTTRIDNVFVIGPGHTSWVTLPKGKGIKLNDVDDRKRRMKRQKEEKKGTKKSSKKTTKK
jgi:small subunit ribosomal protein S4e